MPPRNKTTEDNKTDNKRISLKTLSGFGSAKDSTYSTVGEIVICH